MKKRFKTIIIQFFILFHLYACKNNNVCKVNIYENLTINWSKKDKWIVRDKYYDEMALKFVDIEMILIEALKDSTELFDVSFKEMPLRKGDVALACLLDLGTTHQLYQPEMLKVKLLNQNDPCYFLFINHFDHLEKNRIEYYEFIRDNKRP